MFGRKDQPKKQDDKLPDPIAPEENDLERDARHKQQLQKQAEQASGTMELHTYPDGSQRRGVPPFPEKSPKEEEAELGTDGPSGPIPAQVLKGEKTSGEPAPSPAGGTTEEQFLAKAAQQLSSDVAQGKDPNTPNPTTASDKPGLGGVVPVEDDAETVLSADPTQEELDAIAAKIEVRGDIEATDEEKKAAAVQVARETKGAITAGGDDKDRPKKK